MTREGMKQSREAKANRYSTLMKCDNQIVPRCRFGVMPRKGFIYVAMTQYCKDSRKYMAIYVGGLVVEIKPAFETGVDVVHDGAVPMADTLVVLAPRRELVIRQKAVVIFAFRFGLSRGRGKTGCCCHPQSDLAALSDCSKPAKNNRCQALASTYNGQ